MSLEPILIATATLKSATDNDKNQQQFHQYACIRCRRLKKKCSKTLPVCQNCTKQNETCEYVERKNKRRNLKTVKVQSSTITSQSLSSSPNSSLSSVTDEEIENNQNKFSNIMIPQILVNNISPPQPLSPTIPLRRKSISVQLPPINIGSVSSTTSALDSLPSSSLKSYSLSSNINNDTNNFNNNFNNNLSISPNANYFALPPIPIPATTTTSSFSDFRINKHKGRKNSCSSISHSLRSCSPTNIHSSDRNSLQFSTPVSQTNNINVIDLLSNASSNSFQYQVLYLIFNQIGYIDENIYPTFINNSNHLSSNYHENFLTLLEFIIFFDSSLMMQKLSIFKSGKFNWNGENQLIDDYYNSIEFLLLYTCSIIFSNSKYNSNSKSNLDSDSDSKFSANYLKFTFTMAFKLLKRKSHPLSNVQILRLLVLLSLISLLSDSSIDTSWFIQSILSKYTQKWHLDKLSNLKLSNIEGITLSDVEYLNRLFWTIFITDSLFSSTTFQQPNFELMNINVPLPISITKNEEQKISFQITIIKLCKIQSKIISQLYLSKQSDTFDDNDSKFIKLSLLRQDADMWYNECRITLSNLTNTHLKSSTLQLFAVWMSIEYYYTLSLLFKPSNLFPDPDTPNFTVISNATIQNIILIKDLLSNFTLPESCLLYSRFSNVVILSITSIMKGMYTYNECTELVSALCSIYKSNDLTISQSCAVLINELQTVLKPSLIVNEDKLHTIFSPVEPLKYALKKIIKSIIALLENSGFLLSIDLHYIDSC